MNIEVPVNKKTIPISLITGLLSLVIISFIIKEYSQHGISLFFIVILIILTIYFIAYTFIAFLEFIKTQFDKNALLKVSNIGINDNLSIFSCGTIFWDDITTIEIKKEFNIEVIIIKLTNNDKYLANKNIIQRYILKKWIKKWGTPIIISERKISCNIQELKQIFLKHFL
ncbi:MAG: hypothetical protein HY951_17745 [Bacteroidia bacterium]|nr:hypothetical protein [Bacteroidia bacterium]